MKPSRENIFRVLAALERSGLLPEDGPTSVFLSQGDGAKRAHAAQLAVRVSGDAVFVRLSRLPFHRPLVFSRRALQEAAAQADSPERT